MKISSALYAGFCFGLAILTSALVSSHRDMVKRIKAIEAQLQKFDPSLKP